MASSISIDFEDEDTTAEAFPRPALVDIAPTPEMLHGACAWCRRAFVVSEPKTEIVSKDRQGLGLCHPACARSYWETKR